MKVRGERGKSALCLYAVCICLLIVIVLLFWTVDSRKMYWALERRG